MKTDTDCSSHRISGHECALVYVKSSTDKGLNLFIVFFSFLPDCEEAYRTSRTLGK